MQNFILIGSGLAGFAASWYSLSNVPLAKDSYKEGSIILLIIGLIFFYGTYIIAKQNPKNYYFLVAIMSFLSGTFIGAGIYMMV